MRQIEWGQALLEGKSVNLEIIEKDDLPFLAKWLSTLEFFGEYNPILQQSQKDLESHYDKCPPEEKWFFIEKKDGEKIGFVSHFSRGGLMELGFALIPGQRGKGYGTEAAKIIVDYLFLVKDIVRVQARTDIRNTASQKALEKAGFSREGIIRKSSFSRGEHQDMVLYSILREEWKEPKILTRTQQR